MVVVSPLVALMKDQAAHCTSLGIAAGFVSSDPCNEVMQREIVEGK